MIQFAAILVGAAAGLATLFWGRRFGRGEASFWRWALILMQVVYVVGALVARAPDGALREGLVLAVFTAVAVAASRLSAWFLVFGIFAHGAWDLRHVLVGEGYALPLYPEACVGFDWLAFFYLLTRAGTWDRSGRSRLAPEAAA